MYIPCTKRCTRKSPSNVRWIAKILFDFQACTTSVTSRTLWPFLVYRPSRTKMTTPIRAYAQHTDRAEKEDREQIDIDIDIDRIDNTIHIEDTYIYHHHSFTSLLPAFHHAYHAMYHRIIPPGPECSITPQQRSVRARLAFFKAIFSKRCTAYTQCASMQDSKIGDGAQACCAPPRCLSAGFEGRA